MNMKNDMTNKVNEAQPPIIEAKNLTKKYYVRTKQFTKPTELVAVNDVSLSIMMGETLGLVGESGCGKSTTANLILSLIRPTSGEIYFKGERIDNLSNERIRKHRADMQMIFQDPYASLDPKYRVRDLIGEPLVIFGRVKNKKDKADAVAKLLEMVDLHADDMYKYPHEFSGGQRQRICIARAIALNPSFIVADEAVSALDVSIQAQIIALLQDIKEKQNLTYLFVSHNLSVVKYICDRIVVMYLGKIMEIADKNTLFKDPKHPYTKALLSAVPVIDVPRKRFELAGEIPSPLSLPKGCVFHPRCPHATEQCKNCVPELKYDENGNGVACWLYE